MATAAAQKTERPFLTMPDAEADALRAAYTSARVILEYGSGGSTVVAAEMAGKHITSIESDRKWARMMKRWFAENPPADKTEVNVIWSNIGPTRAWGQPKDDSDWQKYPNYPLGVWQREGFRHPDVVLVDGRFRIGCVLATLYNITRPVTLMIDDYARRSWMQKVEEFTGPARRVGRMGMFDLKPTPVPGDKLLQIVKYMSRP